MRSRPPADTASETPTVPSIEALRAVSVALPGVSIWFAIWVSASAPTASAASFAATASARAVSAAAADSPASTAMSAPASSMTRPPPAPACAHIARTPSGPWNVGTCPSSPTGMLVTGTLASSRSVNWVPPVSASHIVRVAAANRRGSPGADADTTKSATPPPNEARVIGVSSTCRGSGGRGAVGGWEFAEVVREPRGPCTHEHGRGGSAGAGVAAQRPPQLRGEGPVGAAGGDGPELDADGGADEGGPGDALGAHQRARVTSRRHHSQTMVAATSCAVGMARPAPRSRPRARPTTGPYLPAWRWRWRTAVAINAGSWSIEAWIASSCGLSAAAPSSAPARACSARCRAAASRWANACS